MKRAYVVLAAAMGVMALLAGCSGGANGKNGKPVTLTFGINQTGTSVENMTKIAAKFKEETGISIDIQVNPDDQWRDLLKSKLQAGEAPDMFLIDSDPMSINDRIRPAQNCIDFTKEEWVSRIDKEILPSISYKDKVYGITFAVPKRWVIHYNKDIFAKAGIKQLPTTYEELKADCAKIKALGVTPIMEATQNGWHQVLPLFETGGYYLEKHGDDLYDKLNQNKAKLSDIPELKLVIQQCKELADLGYYGKDYLSESVDKALEKMAAGKVAMYVGYVGWGLDLYKDYPQMQGKVGIFMMPFADSDVLGINPANPSFFGNKKTGHVAEIKQFFAFLARPDILDWNLNELSTAYAFCWKDVKCKTERMPKDWQDYLASAKTGLVTQYAVKYVDSQWMDVGKDLEAMYTGAMTIDEVIASADKRRSDQAKLQKDSYWK
jgi:raffinose/stachyose/melibiose transport system substrate-binding protein